MANIVALAFNVGNILHLVRRHNVDMLATYLCPNSLCQIKLDLHLNFSLGPG